MDVRKKVREEKKKYDESVVHEALATREDMQEKSNLVPIDQTGKGMIDKLTKEYYPEEVREHLFISEDKIKPLISALRTMNKNLIKFSGPMVCKGPKCPMAIRCPMQKATIAPVGHSCPIELMLIDQWEKEYIEDLGIDKQSKIELDLVRDMMEADLIDWRTSHDMAENGLFDWNAVGVGTDGKAIYRKDEATSINIKLKFKARKDRLREDLMATRKIKVKFGLNKSVDPSKLASSLQARFKKIQEAEVTDVKDDEMKQGKPEADK